MEKQDNEFMVTNFDSDSDDAYSSSEKEDDGGKMQRSMSVFTPVKTFHLYSSCSVLLFT